jgi:hypothetical protein
MTTIAERVLGILGAIATFMGLVVLFAGEGQYVGFGGDLTWRVGDIGTPWGYGLLIGGLALLAGAGLLWFWLRRHPHEYTEQSERAGLIAHAVVFALVNGFLWFQDIAAGGGLEYAYWVTIPWGVGLVAHAIAYLSSRGHTTTPHPST